MKPLKYNVKRKLLLLIFLSFVFVLAGNVFNTIEPVNPSLYAFTFSTPKPTKEPTPSPSPIPTPTRTPGWFWSTPVPSSTPEPTPSPVPSATPEPTPVPTIDPNAPTPSPTPQVPHLPSVIKPGLDYPATEAPKATLNPDEWSEEVTPEPSPTPEPTATPVPEKKAFSSWSQLIKFSSIICYISAVFTALYSLFFFIICTLFNKKPVSGFPFGKKKKKKKKKKVTAPKKTAKPQAREFDREAETYFTKPEEEEKKEITFRRQADSDYQPIIETEPESNQDDE